MKHLDGYDDATPAIVDDDIGDQVTAQERLSLQLTPPEVSQNVFNLKMKIPKDIMAFPSWLRRRRRTL